MKPTIQWTKGELLANPIRHIDITSFDARPVVNSYREMANTARTLARAADIYSQMLADKDCAVILTLAGSLVSAGLKKALITLVEHNMVDAIVSTGANSTSKRPNSSSSTATRPTKAVCRRLLGLTEIS